jgi:predicted nucleic acid-binding protein
MASPVLVDANVLLDVLTADPVWCAWSISALQHARASGPVVINQIVCAEIAPAFNFDWQKLDTWLLPSSFIREGLPFAASVVAASAHKAYRSNGGKKDSPLPDFYIGAHAQVSGYTLLTRDIGRYRTYFASVPLITPTT